MHTKRFSFTLAPVTAEHGVIVRHLTTGGAQINVVICAFRIASLRNDSHFALELKEKEHATRAAAFVLCNTKRLAL
jgi:hypothetical protein